MPTKKATSAASAARPSAPQTSKAAGRRTSTPESQGASRKIVTPAAKPLQLLYPVITSELIYFATFDMAERDENNESRVIHLAEALEHYDHYLLEHRTTRNNLLDAGADEDGRDFYLRLFASRIFDCAFRAGFSAGRAAGLPHFKDGE